MVEGEVGTDLTPLLEIPVRGVWFRARLEREEERVSRIPAPCCLTKEKKETGEEWAGYAQTPAADDDGKASGS